MQNVYVHRHTFHVTVFIVIHNGQTAKINQRPNLNRHLSPTLFSKPTKNLRSKMAVKPKHSTPQPTPQTHQNSQNPTSQVSPIKLQSFPQIKQNTKKTPTETTSESSVQKTTKKLRHSQIFFPIFLSFPF